MNLFQAINNYTFTENGALTYKTSGSRILDLFSRGGAYRNRSDEDIITLVSEAFEEDPLYTLEVLFYLRDIRGGQGEKRVFRVGINALKDALRTKDGNLHNLFDTIIEIGSWKDIFDYFEFDEWKDYVVSHVESLNFSKPDLVFKYMPSVGGSKNKQAEKLAEMLKISPKEYRKMLTRERKRLQLVETSMCANHWNEVDYNHVPSKAGLLYKNAFAKHDADRYREFITKVNAGDKSVKLNAGTLYPYEITEKYMNKYNFEYCGWGYCNEDGERKPVVDEVLEAYWKSLPVYGESQFNAVVVADTSGSMWGRPMAVSTSLAIYFAQHNTGLFHNKWITFSHTPKFIELKEGESLADSIYTFYKNSEVADTNLQAVFDIMLKAALDYKLPENEMPKLIYIVSDMEFNSAIDNNGFSATNYEVIKEKYARAGYEAPAVVFWNVDARNDQSPVRMNEAGVALISGSSPSTFNLAISKECDPMTFMFKTIRVPRYEEPARRILGV